MKKPRLIAAAGVIACSFLLAAGCTAEKRKNVIEEVEKQSETERQEDKEEQNQTERYEVKRELIPDCNDPDSGVIIITYSDGTMDTVDY